VSSSYTHSFECERDRLKSLTISRVLINNTRDDGGNNNNNNNSNIPFVTDYRMTIILFKRKTFGSRMEYIHAGGYLAGQTHSSRRGWSARTVWVYDITILLCVYYTIAGKKITVNCRSISNFPKRKRFRERNVRARRQK